jgi:hypothetical protein
LLNRQQKKQKMNLMKKHLLLYLKEIATILLQKKK